jgi:hypothetical protein
MTTLTPIAVTAIAQTFVYATKDGVDPVYIGIGFNTLYKLSKTKTDLEVNLIIELPNLPDYLHDKFVRSDNPNSRVMARAFLQANFSHCVFNDATSQYEAKGGVDSLSISSMCGYYFELFHTLTEQRPTENKDYHRIELTQAQQIVLAREVLASINTNSQQAVLDAVVVAINLPEQGNFCSTLSGF